MDPSSPHPPDFSEVQEGLAFLKKMKSAVAGSIGMPGGPVSPNYVTMYGDPSAAVEAFAAAAATSAATAMPKTSADVTTAEAFAAASSAAGEIHAFCDELDAAAMPGQTSASGNKRSRDEANNNTTSEEGTLKKKAAAEADSVSSPSPTETPPPAVELDETIWKSHVLDHLPRCTAAEGIRETSYFSREAQSPSMRHRGPSSAASHASSSTTGGGRIGCLKRLLRELGELERDGDDSALPGNPAIWIRYDEETPQYLRALVTGPAGTPYASGLFAFDLHVPDGYPLKPPRVQLLTTGRGTVGFSPNLYRDGKVCLSLLNTWRGPRWNPAQSTLLQVLVSIQGLILGVEHPYYQEPGYGGWEGLVPAKSMKADGSADANVNTNLPSAVKKYHDQIRDGTVKFAVTEYCQALVDDKVPTPPYLTAFEEVLKAHFWHHKDIITSDAKNWVLSAHSPPQKRRMQISFSKLEEVLKKLKGAEAVAADVSGEVPGVPEQDQKKKAATSVVSRGSSTDEPPETTAKRREMLAAAAAGDYIRAGRLQSELELSENVRGMISSKRRDMEEAAAKKDYVTAGVLQAAVRALERNRKRLMYLERRMFESAAGQDFVKAGRFQEQYRILLESVDDTTNTSTSSRAAAKTPAPASTHGAAGVNMNMNMPAVFHPFSMSKAFSSSYDPMGGIHAYGGDLDGDNVATATAHDLYHDDDSDDNLFSTE